MSKQTAGMELKKKNRCRIYQLLREQSPLTRQDIVQHLGLCLPTVTQNINELLDESLVEEAGSMGNTGGRRARTYGIVSCARTAIGLDITKNHISVVAVNLRGEIISSKRIRSKFEYSEQYSKSLGKLVTSFVKQAGLDEAAILGVGIGVPGLVAADNQTVFYGEILNFTGASCAQIAKHIPYPASLYNDANAASFAEIWAQKEIKNAFYVMLSNNIGGSVVIGGSIYSGEDLRSGEVGHLCIEPHGKPCYCGQSGCVDAYCAATVLSSYTSGNLGDFFELLNKGDRKASAMWSEYLDKLAATVNSLQMLFDCSVILGGYVGEYLEPYLPDLKRRCAKLHSFSDNADYLQVCSYKTQAIAAGAALNYISEFIKSV